MKIETLEARIAPAAATFVYTDVDGDIVKVTATVRGGTPPLDASDFAFVGGGPDGQVATLNLTEAGFDGAKVVFKVTKKPGGDGQAHVGFIDASMVDLDQVVVAGDLGKIIAGDATTVDDPGLNVLSVRTIGTLGLMTQGGVGDLSSVINGKLKTLKVVGDVRTATLRIDGSADGQLDSVSVGGDLVGGNLIVEGKLGTVSIRGNVMPGADGTGGAIFTHFGGDVRSIKIGGSLLGGTGNFSGALDIFGDLGSLKIGGDIIGNIGSRSGNVFTDGSIGSVSVGGGVVGGIGPSSGTIFNFGTAPMGNVSIGGNLRGGAGVESGFLYASGRMGNVTVKGDVVGGSISGSDSLDKSGVIRADNGLGNVTIGGSLIAGFDDSTGTLGTSGAIISGIELGAVKIGGSVVGNETKAVQISAFGAKVAPKPGGLDTAIKSVSVKGDVRFAEILAGFFPATLSLNGDAGIGAISVGGDWVASSAVAGAKDMGAAGWGVGDVLRGGGDPTIIARIASIRIGGEVLGSAAVGDNFGFVAEEIKKLFVARRTIALASGVADNFLVGSTDDVHVLEVG